MTRFVLLVLMDHHADQAVKGVPMAHHAVTDLREKTDVRTAGAPATAKDVNREIAMADLRAARKIAARTVLVKEALR
jgi:hypothetical protein